ncbi:MAG: rhodanese-like domain-containing protein [Clostridia bacterium]|nr:rhodanese-like domain-containing protein [Clostridia bacterium]
MFRRFIYMIEKNFELKRSFDNNKDITKEDLDSYIKQGAIIIDVRSPQEYREGHVDGAISIPDYQIKKEIEKKIQYKDELIVVYCTTGHRSQKTQQMLENMGYTNVYNVYEGIII